MDVAIIGAGPAGSTLAGLLKKYRPDTTVAVFERDRFPRHHIGESLLIDVNRILHDLGALEAVEQAGFNRKYGATFCWGPERRAWHLVWRDIPELRAVTAHEVRYTWHVDRDRYDTLLANHARSLGAVVLEGHEIQDTIDDGDRVRGLVVRTPAGETKRVEAQVVVDASGGLGPLARKRSGRVLDRALLNIAVYGYFEGLRLPPAIFGSPEEPRTGILLHPSGWIWFIPLAGGRTSVGFVTALETHRALGIDASPQYLFKQLEQLPEWKEISRDGRLIDYRGNGELVHAVQEYSFQVPHPSGQGWALCGDSGGFVDAILSVGCFLGHFHAQFLAYALASAFEGACDLDFALKCYGTVVQENVEGLRAISHMFYAYAHSQDQWWRGCSEVVRGSPLLPPADDTSAFLALASGLAARNHLYEEALHFVGADLVASAGRAGFLSAAGFPQKAVESRQGEIKKLLSRNPRLRWASEHRTAPFLLPHTGTGRLKPVTRLEYSLLKDRDRASPLSTLRRSYASPDLNAFWSGPLEGAPFGKALDSALAGLPADRRDRLRSEAWDTALDLVGVGAVEAAG